MGSLWIWFGLVIFRLLWSLLQTSYIHPDEFFQTVEVVSGDILGTDVVRTWEFTETSPLRSLALPYLMFAWFYRAVQSLLLIFKDAGLHPNAQIFLAGPRFIMAVSSLWLDICVYTLCKRSGIDSKTSLILFASSYVTLTYQCHTFTNSLETLLFSGLMYVIVYTVTMVTGNLNGSKKDTNLTFKLQVSTFFISFISICGIFNRPTFPMFAVGPIVWWIYKVILPLVKQQDYVTMIRLAVVGYCAAFFTSLTFYLFDSIYYQPDFLYTLSERLNICLPFSLTSIQCMTEALSNQGAVTPWNFINYNTKGDNLAKHGLHPFYLHFVVNMPLLFGPLMYFLIKKCYKTIAVLVLQVKEKFSKRVVSPTKRSSKHKLTVPYHCFIVIAVFLFSIFPHQEPRFLIPLLPLMILNCASCLKSRGGNPGKLFVVTWILFNLVLSLLYGHLHQGGVTTAVIRLQRLLDTHIPPSHTDTVTETGHDQGEITQVIFTHTYMPPSHLLLSRNGQINSTDLKGSSINTVYQTLQELRLQQDQELDRNTSQLMYLVCPYAFYKKLLEVDGSFSFTVVDHIFPHLSMEDPPVDVQGTSLEETFSKVKQQLSLSILLVDDSS